MNKSLTINKYLSLPFEVYYSESLPIIEMEFLSLGTPKKISDLKGIDLRRGFASGLTFRCDNNFGSELACCILNAHDYIIPDFLQLQDEENMEITSGEVLKVIIEDGKIQFREASGSNQSDAEFEADKLKPSGIDGFSVFEFDETAPDFIILDADNSRIKINLDGYILDENGDQTTERLCDPDEISDSDELNDCNWNGDLKEAKRNWVKLILEKNFHEDSSLEYVD